MVKKALIDFALKNWKAILIVLLLLVVVLKTRYDYHLMRSVYTTMIESSEAQIQGLKDIHAEEVREKALLMESYLESIAAVEREHDEAITELNREKKKKKKQYIRKFSDDKEGLIKDIEDTFGFEHAP